MRLTAPFRRLYFLIPILIAALTLAAFAGPTLAQEDRVRVDVELFEWGINMPDTLAPGMTYFYVTNTGDAVHNFRIEGDGVERTFVNNLPPGFRALMVVDLQPGTYVFSDPIADNAEQGMRVERTVGDGAAVDETAQMTPTAGADAEQTPTVAAGEGAAGQTPTAEVPVTGAPGSGLQGEPFAISLELVAEGLTSPVYLTNANDGTGRLFVVDQTGVIRIIDEDDNLVEEPFLDVRDRMVDLRERYDERGLLGLAFHPDYANNGRFFVYYSAPLREEAPGDWNHTGHVSEFRVSEDDPNMADPDSEQVLLRIDQPQGNHNGGSVLFGPDGYLYISLGDGGAANDVGVGHVEDWYEDNQGGNAQNPVQNLLGKILRIDVDNQEDGQPFAIPADNPFVGPEDEEEDQGKDSIYAFGLRNPYRISFDRGGENQLYAADVGQNLFEEVNIIVPGGNYGWNVKEATHCFSTENPDAPGETCPDTDPMGNELIDPIIEYGHVEQEGGLGISITGGYVYRGNAIPEIQGNYVFGDWSASFDVPGGRLFMAEPQEGDGLWPITELTVEGMDFVYYVMGFGEDEDGELYLAVDENAGPTGTGRIFRFVAADGAAADDGAQATPTAADGQQTPQVTPTMESTAQATQQATPTVEMTPTTAAPQASPTPAAGQGQAPADEDQQALIDAGQRVFTTQCTACHGAQGQAAVGPALANNEFVTQEDPQAVINTVHNGRGQMPAFGTTLSNEQIAAVVSYIRNAWDNDASVVTPDQVE